MRDFFDVLPCFGFLGFFVVLFGFIALMRYIGYRETLALAEKGLVKPSGRNDGDGKNALRWGIVLAALGLALSAGLYPIGFLTGLNLPLGFGPWMIAGFLPMFFGLGLILIYVLTREEKKGKTEEKKEENKSE